MHADYTGQGFDQLLDVIDKIKSNPDDRRIILSAWNPSDLKQMALPPCHMFAQVFTMLSEWCLFPLFSTLIYPFSLISVLRSKRWVVLSNVSALCWYGPRRSLQHCIICIVDMHDCPHLWYELIMNLQLICALASLLLNWTLQTSDVLSAS